ncbi:hypothetical protein FPANT_13890 [Fusarium pseudoanthophilum]|uniref:Uncharacterized protein n=1 Tax=Fusarium pseudoanthophilum TaxID=48495 RepID=A0A8H5KCK9_9HYPO|nr:hypothetical protein FPANT_13890 [Fusarium pseudoanthophilum]
MPMSKFDITRDSMNVSISGQSDMRKMATIIATLASYGHGQAQNEAHGRSGLVNTTKSVAGGQNVVNLDLIGLDASTKIHCIARVDMKTFSDNEPYRATDAA